MVRVCDGGVDEFDCAAGVGQEGGGTPVGEVGGALDEVVVAGCAAGELEEWRGRWRLKMLSD
jgi:hypothetical protein